MNDSVPSFRSPGRSDLVPLSDLAWRSKAHWGYGPEFMEACREELTLDDDAVGSPSVRLMELDGRCIGLFAINPREDDPLEVELELFFLEPNFVGQGYGRRMMREAAQLAMRSGFRRMQVQSDPHAEAFYAAMGFARIGLRPSDSFPERMLPLLRAELAVLVAGRAAR